MKKKPRLAFVFPARHKSACIVDTITQLSRKEPVFKSVLERCDREIVKRVGWSIYDKVSDLKKGKKVELGISYPILTATQIALCEVSRHRGITPDAILGICAGEFAAGYIGGVVSLANAIELACRGFYEISRRSARGKGIIVALSQNEADALRSGAPNEFYFGAALAQRESYLACEQEAQLSLITYFKERGVSCEGARGMLGFHSPLAEAWRETFLKPLEKDNGSDWPRVPYYSPMVGGEVDDQRFDDGSYWWHVVRMPLFIPSVYLRMIDDGFEMFLDVGNSTHLSPCIHEMASVRQKEVTNVFFMSAESSPYRVFQTTCKVVASHGIGETPGNFWIRKFFHRPSAKSEQN